MEGMSNEIIEIVGRRDQYRLVRVDRNESRPHLRADLESRGFDGCIYHTARVLTGRQTAEYRPLCIRSRRTGQYQTMY